jgi:uncharacterized protein (TIGR00645 family)
VKSSKDRWKRGGHRSALTAGVDCLVRPIHICPSDRHERRFPIREAVRICFGAHSDASPVRGINMSTKPDLEIRFERGLFTSRWLMAPMYLGLVVALGMLTFVFLRQLIYYVPQAMSMDADQAILAILTLIDLTLAGNLLLIVLFSGYENFVSKLDISNTVDRPTWMGTVDFSDLKMKLIASIVAISGIFLLKQFMEIGNKSTVNESYLMWLVIIHLTFVCSGVLLALMDWLTAKSKKR